MKFELILDLQNKNELEDYKQVIKKIYQVFKKHNLNFKVANNGTMVDFYGTKAQ